VWDIADAETTETTAIVQPIPTAKKVAPDNAVKIGEQRWHRQASNWKVGHGGERGFGKLQTDPE
jgi:hypothetical protein